MRKRIREATSRVAQRLNLAPGDVQGYQQLTVRAVTEEAGISIGTFYKYFDNRDDLAQSLWAEPVEQLRIEMQADFDQAENPTDKIKTLLQHYVRFSVENRRVFRAAFLFVRPDGHPQRAAVDLEDEMFYTNLRTALEAGQKAGAYRDFDSHTMAQTFWAAIHGALALPENLDRYNFDSAEQLADSMIELLLAAISA